MKNKPKRQLYKVEMCFSYGWDDAGWRVSTDKGDRPTRFHSVKAAEAEIRDHISSMKDAIKHGYMQGPADKFSDYRVVPVQPRNFKQVKRRR